MKYTGKFAGGFCLLLLIIVIYSFTMNAANISRNKETVNTYMEGFREGNHSKILSCLTDDVVWEMPGVYYHRGKEEFDKEIENENFIGKPKIQVTRMIEESDVVVAEGAVQGRRKDGGELNAVFCDVFLMRGGKINKVVSYLMVKNP